ncbi:unnamed protein product [Rhizoctonia solani]|uniref:F-box domain-containing protein n=1 Tax=Rhizoctonia solani TaxID=456999 RepID=A0A8H3I1F8_9AGAM|nr:unnamed protein product [Rhizoctonia solani]
MCVDHSTYYIKWLASHRRKRRKAKKDNPYPDLALDRCYLAELPLEVLANVLGYVYPIDLLALSRAGTYFHRTLSDPQQQHIWKTARANFPHVNIPDPVRISEVRVASLLFDGSDCSICKDTSHAPLKSHRYPTRVCSKSNCRKHLFQAPKPEHSALVCGIIPSRDVLASDPYGFYHAPLLMFQRRRTLCRKDELEMIMKDISAGLGKVELEAKYKCTFEETAEFNCYMVNLGEISSTLIRLRSQIDSQIRNFANQKLSAYKGKEVHVTSSPQFIAERRRAIRSYREISQEDWDTMPPRGPTQNPAKPALTVGQIIIQEMDEMVAKSKRRKDQVALQNTRETVKKYWEQMMNDSGMAGESGTAIPQWNEFASLPVVNSLLKPAGHDKAFEPKDLEKGSTLANLIQSAISTWDSRTQAQFRKILNVPKTPAAKKNEVQEPGIVPPLDRVTALFECTKCKTVGLGLTQEGTLTFKSAVKHRCPGTSPKKFQWSTGLFQPDQYATQVARHAVSLSELAEDKTKRSDMDALGTRFHCKLCTGKKPIYLPYRNLIGHMKRHGTPEPQESFEYLKEPLVLDSKIPSSDGLVEKRRRGTTQGFASHPDSKDFFTCRHCDKKSMLWNGLVSHVKEKHEFSDIRDEDFYPELKKD